MCRKDINTLLLSLECFIFVLILFLLPSKNTQMNGCQTHVDDTENLKTHRSILVGNIHVLFNPSRGDIKLGQVRLFLAKAHRLLETWGNIPIILGGDFNSMPQLNIQHHERKKICGQNCPLHYPTFQCHSNYYSSRSVNPIIFSPLICAKDVNALPSPSSKIALESFFTVQLFFHLLSGL
ncbi:carbon catabolite repressor protein 4 homolog 3 isoform X2 [Lactuca sativa]|uniref:carbon catabolite repressor protein 4 homolog 3 isoform X2 n=1 Tax=Lactuca sativa TaxID=4236 RepID=UPI0022AFAE79|nr:carbon catabolite repressor protein 4 homolog 3 isoform X2 [Lactuca sativa]